MKSCIQSLLWSLIILACASLQSQAQTFTATQNASDAHVDLSWEIPVDPCLLDQGLTYRAALIQIKANGTIIEEIRYNNLNPFYDNNQSIRGTFRDRIGPDQTRTYTLELELSGGNGNSNDAACMPISVQGSTLPYQPPTGITVSNDQLERVDIGWTHNSDWVTRYDLRRTDLQNATTTLALDVGPLNKGQTYQYADAFRYNQANSIENGVAYDYTLVGVVPEVSGELPTDAGRGSTIPIGLAATDASDGRPETVLLTWNAVSAYAEQYEVLRNGETLTRLSTDGTTQFVDTDPTYGVISDYELRFFRNGEAIASAYDQGGVQANGYIQGKVVTQVGSFPVKGITVNLTGPESYTAEATTDEQGIFHFPELVYGLKDTFEITAAELAGHEYFPDNQEVILSKRNPRVENVLLFDAFTYNAGFAQIAVETFTLTPLPAEDKVQIDWVVSSNVADTRIEIIRDGQTIYQDISNNQLVGSFTDLTGAPGKQYEYTLRAYQISGDLANDPNNTRLTSVTQKATTTFPMVAPVPDFAVSDDQSMGWVNLQWLATSENMDGFRIYRNDVLIAELDGSAAGYQDKYAPPGSTLNYALTAFRTVDNLTTESVANNHDNVPVIFPALPVPRFVQAVPQPETPAALVVWQPAAGDNYNFSGYKVYRKSANGQSQHIATIYKARQERNWIDYRGAQAEIYTYEVSSFLQSPAGEVFESDKVATTAVTYPTLPAPDFSVFQVAHRYINSTPANPNAWATLNYNWTTPPGMTNYDGFILYLDDSAVLDTLSFERRFYFNVLNEQDLLNRLRGYRLRAYREVDGTIYLSPLADPSKVETGENFAGLNPPQGDPPQDFKASTDLRSHVQLTWKNEDISEKAIFRYDGFRNEFREITRVSSEAESFVDYTLPQDYDRRSLNNYYQLVSDINTAKPVFAVGEKLPVQKIKGRVYNQATGIGIPGAAIRINSNVWNLASSPIAAFTDSTGYYEINQMDVPDNAQITVTTSHPNAFLNTPNQSFTFGNRKEVVINFEDGIEWPAPEEELATITAFAATPDPVNRQINLHWSTSSGAYDGFELRRGTDLIAFIPRGAQQIYLDSLVAPGINYSYLVRPYKNTQEDRIVSPFRRVDVTVPALEPVNALTAIPDRSNNQIVVEWSHKYDNHAYYQILRNEVPVGAVPTGGILRYVDPTGSPEQQYKYTVLAIDQVQGQGFRSKEASVLTTFPEVATVHNVSLSAPTMDVRLRQSDAQTTSLTQNHVRVEWTYADTSQTMEGFHIYRNGQIIGSVADTARHFLDYSGIPGEQYQYAVTARKRNADNLVNESPQARGEIVFPAISSAYEVAVRAIPSDGNVQISFSYLNDNVQQNRSTRFYVYRHTTTAFTNIHIIDTVFLAPGDTSLTSKDLAGVPQQLYYYGVQPEITKVSPQTNLNTPYRSITVINERVLYPNVPPPTNLTASNTNGFDIIEFAWDYPVDNSIDYFELRSGNTRIAEIDKNRRTYVHKVTTPIPEGRDYQLSAVRFVGAQQYRGTASIRAAAGNEQNSISISSGQLDELGWAVKMTGTWLVVGAPIENGTGAVHIYRFSEPALSWYKWAVIPGNLAGERFGHSVDIWEDRIVIGAPNHDQRKGRVVVYEFINDQWRLTHEKTGEFPLMELGFDVAIDQDLMVASLPNFPNLPANARPNYNMYTVSKLSGNWRVVGFLDQAPYVFPPVYDFGDNNTFREGHSIELYNGRLFTLRLGLSFLGDTEASYTMKSYRIMPQHVGWQILHTLAGLQSIPEGPVPFMMGLDLNFNKSNNGVSYPSNNSVLNGNNFWDGQSAQSTISAFPYSYTYSDLEESCTFAYTERNVQAGTTEVKLFPFDTLNPPPPGPEKGFGKAIAATFTHTVAGAPGVIFPYRLGFDSRSSIGELLITRNFYGNAGDILTSVEASNGSTTPTTITWTTNNSESADVRYRIFRDDVFIGEAGNDVREFQDNPPADISQAIIGKSYIYTVVPYLTVESTCQNGDLTESRFYYTPKSDEGFSRPVGEISGQVLVEAAANIGVKDVVITATAFVDGNYFSATRTTNNAGEFFFRGLKFDEGGTAYTLTAEFKDHRFSGIDPVVLSADKNEDRSVLIFDQTSYVVSGQVARAGVSCGQENKLVRYFETINGTEAQRDSALTDATGSYSFIVNPYTSNLSSIRIAIADIQILEGDTTQHAFAVDQVDNPSAQIRQMPAGVIFTDVTNLPLQTRIDFVDNLQYSVPVAVQNACGDPVSNDRFRVQIFTEDLCFDTIVTTSTTGTLNLNLPPLNYQIVVTGVDTDAPSPAALRAIDYLKVRPVRLPLADIHRAAKLNTVNAPSVQLTYHERANISFDPNAFDQYVCDDFNRAAIIQQGQNYQVNFDITENFNNANCRVNEGYLLVYNSAATDDSPRRLDLSNGFFPTYRFTAGGPNLISPYLWTITVQYYSSANSLIAERAIPMIVEGSAALPGAGLNIRLDEKDGEVQLPLFVLRDPPGDRSYASIGRGTSIDSELTFKSSSSGSAGLYVNSAFSFGGVGFFLDNQTTGGGSNARTNSLNLNIQTTDEISTSSDGIAPFVGRTGDVIVGVGLASSFGILQGIRVVDCDSVQLFTEQGFNADGISTEWNYTVGAIEALIHQLRQDSVLISEGNLTYRYPDGTPYREADALLRVGSEIRGWEKILEYHDVQTLPHYILCADDSYRDRLSPANQQRFDQWQGAFCGEIGRYEGDEFILNDNIFWTNDLVNKFRNTSAVLETLKGTDIGQFDNGDLDFSPSEYAAAERELSRLYENATDTSIINVSLSGGVSRTFNYTAQRTASTDIELSRFFNFSLAGGLYFDADVSAGLLVQVDVVNTDVKLGASIGAEATFQVNRTTAESESSQITVHLEDDDPEDNYSVTIIPSPMANHTPYFALTGGQSSCPPEEALSTRDNAPLPIDNFSMVLVDPMTGATGTSISKNNIPTDEVVVLRLRIKNNTNLNFNRVAEIFATNNTQNLGIKAEGKAISSRSTASFPFTGSEEQEIEIAFQREAFTSVYEFEKIRITLKPFCVGEDTRFDLEPSTFVEVNLRFQQPCSAVSLGAPLDGFVVNRLNNAVFGDRETLTFQLYDLDVDNSNLSDVRLEYRRLGANSRWTRFAQIPAGEIRTEYESFPLDQEPYFRYDWDITGEYDRYPDGEYIVRAVSNCGAAGGLVYSNEIQGSIKRSALNAVGQPQPADGVWIRGDEISVTYSRNLDCGLINTPNALANNFKLLDRSNNDTPVPFKLVCSNGKLTIQPTVSLTEYDGKTLVAVYKNVPDAQGNFARDIEWPFKVVAQQADWADRELSLRLYQGEMCTLQANILNTTGNLVSGLQVQRSDANSASWLTIDPTENLNVPPAGGSVTLTVDGDRAPGEYTDDIALVGMDGRTPVLRVKVLVLPPPPVVGDVPDLPTNMKVVANWRFEDFNITSTDSLDQIHVFIDGELRGKANIKAVGPFFAAIISVTGREEDAGKPMTFRVWHGNALNYYEGLPLSGIIQYEGDSKVGSLEDPELIIVKDAITVNTQEVAGRNANSLRLNSFPNPFTESATITFELKRRTETNIRILNTTGKLVYEQTESFPGGANSFVFSETTGLPAGVYFVHLMADGVSASHPMVLIK